MGRQALSNGQSALYDAVLVIQSVECHLCVLIHWVNCAHVDPGGVRYLHVKLGNDVLERGSCPASQYGNQM